MIFLRLEKNILYLYRQQMESAKQLLAPWTLMFGKKDDDTDSQNGGDAPSSTSTTIIWRHFGDFGDHCGIPLLEGKCRRRHGSPDYLYRSGLFSIH